MQVNDVTGAIIAAAMTVHTALGPGLLENAYKVWLGQACLFFLCALCG